MLRKRKKKIVCAFGTPKKVDFLGVGGFAPSGKFLRAPMVKAVFHNTIFQSPTGPQSKARQKQSHNLLFFHNYLTWT